MVPLAPNAEEPSLKYPVVTPGPAGNVTTLWEPERMPYLIGVAVGAFADPSFPQPEQSVFTTSKHAWVDLPGEMRAFATLPSTGSPRD